MATRRRPSVQLPPLPPLALPSSAPPPAPLPSMLPMPARQDGFSTASTIAARLRSLRQRGPPLPLLPEVFMALLMASMVRYNDGRLLIHGSAFVCVFNRSSMWLIKLTRTGRLAVGGAGAPLRGFEVEQHCTGLWYEGCVHIYYSYALFDKTSCLVNVRLSVYTRDDCPNRIQSHLQTGHNRRLSASGRARRVSSLSSSVTEAMLAATAGQHPHRIRGRTASARICCICLEAVPNDEPAMGLFECACVLICDRV